MRAGEQARADEEGSAQQRAQNDQSAPAQESLLDFAAAMVTLVRQSWRDRFALAKAELRLAYSSVFLLIGLAVFLAMTLMLIWVLVLAGIGYWVLEAGVSWFWVLAGAIVAQLVLAWYLRRQVRILARSFSFPETRRAFSRVPWEAAVQPTPETEGARADEGAATDNAAHDKPGSRGQQP